MTEEESVVRIQRLTQILTGLQKIKKIEVVGLEFCNNVLGLAAEEIQRIRLAMEKTND